MKYFKKEEYRKAILGNTKGRLDMEKGIATPTNRWSRFSTFGSRRVYGLKLS
jgi:hypothetical protein